jgi:RNA-directed DNA polymerase
MHYAYDIWMQKKHPQNPWCRYADDGLVHCRTLKEAEEMRKALDQRLKECGLEMHPEKTKIVYCKDNNRKKEHQETQFTFLGFEFKRRQAKNNKTSQKFDSFLPAISTQAFKAIKNVIKQEWALLTKVHMNLEEITKAINPQIRGWINYYGKYYGSSLGRLKRHIDKTLARWVRRKHKKLAQRRLSRSYEWLERVRSKTPKLFVHWYLGKAY